MNQRMPVIGSMSITYKDKIGCISVSLIKRLHTAGFYAHEREIRA